jgi:hypothetical protein
MWSALSDERTDLSFTTYNIFTFYMLLQECIYAIYTSLLSVQACFSCTPYNPFARNEYKTPFPTVTLLLHDYPLPRERVYRAVAEKRLYAVQYLSE